MSEHDEADRVCVTLEPGRSVSACQKAYDHLLSNPSTIFPLSLRSTVNPDPKGTPKQRKRQYPSGDGPMAVDRIIQPRISDFSSVNDPFNAPPPPAATAPGEPPKKKRGRPSKAEHEIRMAEYAARGEPPPPPRKPKTPKRSAERPAPTVNMFTSIAGDGGLLSTPTPLDAGAVGPSPVPGEQSRVDPADQVARTLALEATALAAEQMPPPSGDEPEPVAESQGPAIPTESLEIARELGPPEALPPPGQEQEHAARVDHQTGDPDPPERREPAPDQRVWEAYQPPTSA